MVEHQTVNLAVTGSTPVPTPQARKGLLQAAPEAGQCVIGHRRPSDQQRENSGHTACKAVPGGIDAQGSIPVLSGGSTAECHVVRG